MAFIISDIQGSGCPTVLLNKGIRTDYVVIGDPYDPTITGNSIKFEAELEVEVAQKIRFAICGVSKLSFSYNGLIETNNSGYDVLTIEVTGTDVDFLYQRESVEGVPEGYETVSGSGDVDLDNDNPCGYFVDVSFNTGDTLYNDGVFYSVNLSYT